MADKRFNPTIIEENLGAVSIAACIMASPLLRPWYCNWGATKAEVKMSLPGDELVPHPKLETTRAITIQTPAAEIWPWLVQLGQGRGGLYSYEWLENLIGCDMRNADRILPEHQDLKVGDKVRLGPEGYPYFDVAVIEPGWALILRGDMPGEQTITTTWIWLFYLNPLDEKSTRPIIRSRLVYEPTLGNFLSWRVFTDPISFVMERKTLQGIKVRAEAAAAN
jgi:hypothetical protein